MKTSIKILFAALGICFLQFTTSAQAPQRMNYQAVARNDAGEVLNGQNIEVRFSIHTSTENGTIVYSEEHLVSTNPFGVFTAIIGEGINPFGDFATIDWGSASKFLQVEIDPDGNGWNNMGTTELLSVPYALYSANGGVTYVAGEGITISSNTISNTITTLDALLDVNTTGADPGQVLKWNGSAWVADNDIGGGNGDNWGTQTIQHDATLSGEGIIGNELFIAQQGATNGQVLKWDGSTWVPSDDVDTDTDTDNQTLTLDGSNLSISGGNSVTLPAGTAYSAGTGISIAGSTITNTGDTDATNDLTNSSVAAGDVTGMFSNLQIAANAVGSAEISDNAIGESELSSTTVVAGTYGSATQSPQFTVDADGRITGVTNQTIAGGGGGDSQWTASGNNIYNNNTGNVGIGISNPLSKLDVAGIVSLNDYELRLGAGSDPYHRLGYDFGLNGPSLGGWNGGALSSTEDGNVNHVLRWTETGRVGINNITPLSTLDVGGIVSLNQYELRLNAGDNPYHRLVFDWGANGPSLGGWSGGVLSSTADGNVNHVLRWTDEARVGINNNTPLSTLDVGGNISYNYNELRLANGDNPYHRLVFDNGANGPSLGGWSGGVLSSTADGNVSHVLRWTDLGRVGINNNNPLSTLDVGGNVSINDNELRLRDGTDPYHRLKFDGDVNGPSLGGWSGGALSSTANGTNVPVLRWTDAGRVGINTTDPWTALDVNGAVRIADGTQGEGKVLTSDANGVASWQPSGVEQVAFQAVLYGFEEFDDYYSRVLFNTIESNYGDAFDPVTSVFTAPSAGLYLFYFQAFMYYLEEGSSYDACIRKFSEPIEVYCFGGNNLTEQQPMGGSALIYLDAGEQVEFVVENYGGSTETIGGLGGAFTYAYGYKIF